MTRIAIVVSHPIQHFCPQYKSWASIPEIEIKVFFASTHGVAAYEDKGFGKTIKWDSISLDFPHEFLPCAEGKLLGAKLDSRELVECVEAFSPNALIVYGYSQKLQRRALGWASNHNVPIIMISDSELRSKRNPLKALIKSCYLPAYFRKISYFLTVGDSNEAYYRKYGVADERLVRSFFPIDQKHYDSVLARRNVARKRIRGKLGIPESQKVVLSVGKFVPWKRQSDLVAFSNMNGKNCDDVTVILAGSGQDEDSLRAEARKIGIGGVIFAGFVSPELLAEYYCAADVYVHCSSHEPHSLAISEAIYCSLPVVISSLCGSYGPTDDVQGGLNGFVYKCGDIDDLQRKLTRLLADNNLRESMAVISGSLGRRHQQLAHGGALIQALRLLEK